MTGDSKESTAFFVSQDGLNGLVEKNNVDALGSFKLGVSSESDVILT